jgi:hypothetical protein
MLAEDGSGKGAGLVSAIAQRINARKDIPSGNVNAGEKVPKPVISTTTNGVNGLRNAIHTSALNGHKNGLFNARH